MAIDMEGKYKRIRLARLMANERDRIDAEEGNQMRANRMRANTMPVASVKYARDKSLLPNSMLKEKEDSEAKGKDKPKDTDAGRIAKQVNRSEDSEAKGNDGSYGSSKKKKDPIVSKAEFDKSGFTNLRDFMNAKKYDEATGKFVDRAKALTRRDGRPANAVVSPTTANPKDYKKGGLASSRGDGIAQRGKTRGKMV